LVPGTLIADRFLVVRLASVGGMSEVYRAEDRLTGEPVAVKVPELDMEGRERFLREARLLSELKAPGIVRYVAHGLTPGGRAYLAMEWLEGEDLSQRLERAGLTTEEALLAVAKIAEALAPAHTRGVIHRDLKPGNVFLPNGDIQRLKLIDFGIARSVAGGTKVTRTGSMVGTPAYMAPEQARGGKDVDARADVFSLGCILYECLAGRPPFTGTALVNVLTAVLFEDPPPLSDLHGNLPPRLEELVHRMLAKDPDERPRDATEVAAALASVGPVDSSQRGPTSSKRKALTGSERRIVSLVMIAPEEDVTVRTLTNDEVASIATDLQNTGAPFGANVERLADGSIVATLTSSSGAGDQAARAARLALALQERLPGRPIAVCTGRGQIMGQLPVGEVAERAATLVRGPNSTIHIDETTAGLLDSRFDVSDAFDLRGVRSDKDEPGRTLLGKRTPCVGREREISSLFAVADEVACDSVARAVLVTAPPGIGKSRLRAEVVRLFGERQADFAVLTASADPMRAGSPFGLVCETLRTTCGLLPSDSHQTQAQKLADRVCRHVPKESRARVAAFLGELLGIPGAAAATGVNTNEDDAHIAAAREDRMLMGDQLRRAWEDFVAAECDAHPVVIILDDLQWGDLSSVKLIDGALRLSRDKPLMVLAFARPEVHDILGLPWAERGVTEIRLAELSKRAAERLIGAVLGAVPKATVDRIVEAAAGNAFFLEELIRTVAEGRGDALPSTVLAIVQSRLESLPGETRRVLRAASVFGQTFWKSGVAMLIGGASKTATLDESLHHLTDTELITRAPTTRYAGDEEYVFRHALVRDAAYAMLTPDDGALGHRLAAEWLESKNEHEWLAVAEHYERGARPLKAVAAYTRACAQSLEGNDFASAAARARRGIDCGASGEARGTLLWMSAEASFWKGDFADAARTAAEAAVAFGPGSKERFAALGIAAEAASTVGDHAAFRTIARSLRVATPADDTDVAAYVVALAHAATRFLYLSAHTELDETLDAIERCIVRAPWESRAFAGWVSDARSTRAMAKGDMAACLRLMDRAAQDFNAAGDLRNACRERGHVGYAYMDLGVYDAAEAALRDALATARRLGLVHIVATAKHNLGRALMGMGRLDEAIAVETEAANELTALNDPRLGCAAWRYAAEIELRRHQLDAALVAAERSMNHVDTPRPMHCVNLAITGRVLLAMGRNEEALERAQEAYMLLDSLGSIEEGEAVILLVYIEALLANDRDATQAIARAHKLVLERAALVRDDVWRKCFLENVPEHARILELAAGR
jgi:serine/threonine protein kinase/tetratricopeptide (TPR) repeat protein